MVVLIIKLTKYCLVLAQGNIGMSLLASDYQERRRLQVFTFALISEISPIRLYNKYCSLPALHQSLVFHKLMVLLSCAWHNPTVIGITILKLSPFIIPYKRARALKPLKNGHSFSILSPFGV